MTITRNLTANTCSIDNQIIVEIFDNLDMVHTFTVPNRDGFVRKIDRELQNANFARTTGWEIKDQDTMTFTVDHYGE
jgi:hypothetical protein